MALIKSDSMLREFHDLKFKQIVASRDDYLLLALTITGKLYKIQINAQCRLQSIKQVHINDFNEIIVEKIIAGSFHYILIDTEGTCFAWGTNNYSQCGILEDNSTVSFPYHIDQPKCIDILRDDIPIADAACGASHSLLLSKEGDLYAMGSNKFGQCGIKDVSTLQLQPTLVEYDDNSEPLENVEQIACGSNHSVIFSGGRVWACGNDKYGAVSAPHNTDINHIVSSFSSIQLSSRASFISTGLLWNTFIKM
jgi:alpha-tubulin suppressor-like RCC1 family protein